jgi:hypothetical protein
MEAIKVRYLGPTESLGGRWVASAGGKRVTVGFHSAPGVLGSRHHGGATAAAMELAQKLEWRGLWVRGALDKGDTQVFVNVAYAKGTTVGTGCRGSLTSARAALLPFDRAEDAFFLDKRGGLHLPVRP